MSNQNTTQTKIVFSLSIVCLIFLSSCVTTAYFNTPNDVNKIKAKVHFTDGTTKDGLLTVLFENKIDINENTVDFIASGDTVKQKINIDKIKDYVIDSNVYVPKKIDLYLNGTYHLLFVKRMTKETDKMQLYKLQQLYKSNTAGNNIDLYYIAFPSFSRYEVLDITSNKLLPNFDEKMSVFVSDCDVLAKKIKAKEKGYFYSISSFSFKREEVIKQLVKEYNACN